jgi:hypothetical protein
VFVETAPFTSTVPPTAEATVTFTVLVTEQPPLLMITVYVPDLAAVALLITGFCCADVKPAGPLHA